MKCVVLIAALAVAAGEDGVVSRLVQTAQGPIEGYKVKGEELFAFYGIPYATAPIGIHKFKEVIVACVTMKCVVLIAALAVAAGEDGVVSRLVQTAQGPIEGYKVKGEELFAFYGIPYATVPIGIHKYKDPLPPPQWTTTFEAINKNIICSQRSSFLSQHGVQQEDCLVANVYVPITNGTNLPVVVYVHGGAYQVGYGDLITAKQLLTKKNMIVVNFNYRLGVHGFLCLGTEDIPGNAGMKDQVALLRWVKRNIGSFGGNPNDVTLIGYSAGSSAVDLLLLSPMTKGLFHKVIPESGASLSAFSVQSDPMEAAWTYAKNLKYTHNKEDIRALEQFYKTISFDTMFSIDLTNLANSTFFFSPCVERDIGKERFLDDVPLSTLKNGRNQKVPMLFGFSDMEGLMRKPLFENWKEQMNERFEIFLPGDLKFASTEERESVAQRIKEFYFGTEPVNENTIFRYVDYFTDVLFGYGTLKSAKLQVQSGNKEVYLYEYSFVDENTPLVFSTQVRGADHCAQTFVIGDGIPILSADSETEDLKKMKDLMRNIWINFITTGKPVPDRSDLPYWPSIDVNGGPHMSLDKTLKLRGPLVQQRVLFWDSIYEKYYRMPVPPIHPLEGKTEL